ncbi:MAG: VacJ family lipoprotein, partial [Candidatus Margulisbacteria bacterium]|nr:VacJ family lipoprotein [Candidatus Margulisiibacteriota bacterium]
MLYLRYILLLIVLLSHFSIAHGNEENLNDDFSFFDDTTVSHSTPYDPLMGFNRVMTHFNDWTYVTIMRSIGQGYRTITPEFFRLGSYHFFQNILFPVRFVNNILQFKFEAAGTEVARFCINSTVGVLGIMDLADRWFHLYPQKEDFGQTLGAWGIGAGPFLVLPFYGPTTLRDMFGLVGDFASNPISYVTPDEHRYVLQGVHGLTDFTYKIDTIDEIRK